MSGDRCSDCGHDHDADLEAALAQERAAHEKTRERLESSEKEWAFQAEETRKLDKEATAICARVARLEEVLRMAGQAIDNLSALLVFGDDLTAGDMQRAAGAARIAVHAALSDAPTEAPKDAPGPKCAVCGGTTWSPHPSGNGNLVHFCSTPATPGKDEA